MNWPAGRVERVDQRADSPDAVPAADMTAAEDQRLLQIPSRQLVTAEDLFPPALLALFVLLPPPLGNLALGLLAVLALVTGLQVWRRYRIAVADAG
jgi:hypothetical protein